MAFDVKCHQCGKLLYSGRGMIPIHMIRRKTDGKCPNCGRRLRTHPITMNIQ